VKLFNQLTKKLGQVLPQADCPEPQQPGRTGANHEKRRQGIPVPLTPRLCDRELLTLYKAMDVAG